MHFFVIREPRFGGVLRSGTPPLSLNSTWGGTRPAPTLQLPFLSRKKPPPVTTMQTTTLAVKVPDTNNNMDREGHANDIDDIQLQCSALAVAGGLVLCPLTFISSFWIMNAREEAVVLNCGVLTEHHTSPGLKFSNSCAREIRTVSTAQLSVDVMNQKVTDATGNPIIVSAVVTYRVTNARRALLNVNDPIGFVNTQAAAAVKLTVARYTYDQLKTESEDVQLELVRVLQPRVATAGVTIQSVSLNELNYAPEIAAAMLKKQAAQALVDARQVVVKGAIGVAQQAVKQLEADGLNMTDQDKFKLVSSLLIVVAGDREASPVMSV